MVTSNDTGKGRVLLTGASGFISSHVLTYLLDAKYSVTITTRSEEKAKAVINSLPENVRSRVDHVVISDLSQPNVLVGALGMHPFTAVIHTAAPYQPGPCDPRKDFIDPIVNTTRGILTAVHENAPLVKKVIITSSTAAIFSIRKHQQQRFHYDESSYSPLTPADSDENHHFAYSVAKTMSEQVAWDFMRTKKPNFTLTTINPTYIFGPPQPFLTSTSQVNASNARVLSYLKGPRAPLTQEPRVITFVDVRDAAEAHVRALEVPEAAGQRFLLCADYFTNKRIVEAIRKAVPAASDVLPGEDEDDGGVPKWAYTFDNSKSKQVLGIKYRTLEESIGDTAKTLSSLFPDWLAVTRVRVACVSDSLGKLGG